MGNDTGAREVLSALKTEQWFELAMPTTFSMSHEVESEATVLPSSPSLDLRETSLWR